MGEKSNENGKENEGQQKGGRKPLLTKVVIRRLPPAITENEFLEQVAPLPSYDHFYFVPADPSLSPWSYSRAYISFANVDDVIQFTDRFDGYVFLDAKGNECPAVVELAPNQKAPTKKVKKDAKCGIIEQDMEFKRFLEELKNPKTIELQTLATTLAEIEKREKDFKDNKGIVKSKTPLIEFIEWRKEEKKKHREEKRRQKEEERQRREEERLKRVEREKAEAAAAKRKRELEMQRQNEAREKAEEKQSGPKREKAPRFAKKSTHYRTSSDSQPDENVEHESTNRLNDSNKATTSKNVVTKSGSKSKPQKVDNFEETTIKADGKRYEEKRSTGRRDTPANKGRQLVRDNEKTSTYVKIKETADQNQNRTSEATTSRFDICGSESNNPGDRSIQSSSVKDRNRLRYKDKPSVPLYEPGHRRKQLADSEKPLIFKETD